MAVLTKRLVKGSALTFAELDANFTYFEDEVTRLEGRDGVVSVTDAAYGATGDGSTDDQAAIQAAINAVSTNGGIVLIPQSDNPYIIGAALQMKANVQIVGAGAGTIIQLNSGANTSMITASGAIPHWGLYNMVLDGNRGNQDGDGNNPGIVISLSNTTSTYGTNHTLGSTLTDAYYTLQHLLVVDIDGDGIQTSGAGAGVIFKCDFVGVNGIGVKAQASDMDYVACNVGGSWKEGFLAAGGSSRFSHCKAFFCGTGGAANGTYGNYTLGYGWRVTSRGQHFVNCQAQDTDGPGFAIQGDDCVFSGCYIDNPCMLELQSANIGQSPTRGGGFNNSKLCGVMVRGAQNVNFQGTITSRGVAAADFSGNLECFVQLTNDAQNNIICVSGQSDILEDSTTPWVSESGLNNYYQHNTVITPHGIYRPVRTLDDGDTTPLVFGTGIFETANTGSTTITDFDLPTENLEVGEQFSIRITDANTTITDGANIVSRSGSNITAQGLYTFVEVGGVFYEV